MWPKIELLLSFPSVPPFSNCFSHFLLYWPFVFGCSAILGSRPIAGIFVPRTHVFLHREAGTVGRRHARLGAQLLVLAIYQHMCLSSVFHIKYIYTSYVLVYCRVWRYSTQFFSGTGTYFRYQIFPLPVLVLIFGTKFFSTSSAVPVLNFGIKFFRFLWFFRYQISPVPVPELFPVPPKTSQELRILSSVTINCQVTKIVMNPGSQLSVL